VLDLYSGSRRFAGACVKRGFDWVLSMDFIDDPALDLLATSLQSLIESLIDLGCFILVFMQPPCSSFSIANTPPIRPLQFPLGVPSATDSERSRLQIGNRHAKFVFHIVAICLKLAIAFVVENPDSSWLFKLRSCRRLLLGADVIGFWRTDFCRWGTPWRKRTRFLSNASALIGHLTLCAGGHTHFVLRGQCSGQAATRLAEPYPVGLVYWLASACASSVGLATSKVAEPSSVANAARKRLAAADRLIWERVGLHAPKA
jgi:hypothetical protein